MNNDIIKLLNLEDDCVINSINISANQTKTISLSKLPSEKYCPICNFRMHSKTILKSCFANACTKATANYRLAVLPRRILNLDFRSSSERILLFSARPMLYAILFQRTIYLTMLS